MSRKPPEVPASAGTTFSATLGRLVPSGELGIAVSGGPDSLALLLLCAKARPGKVRAATVDHGLRADSAEEAAGVGRICAQFGVPHDILRVAVAPGASLQAQARAARYGALGAWAVAHGLAAVATAHHLDDQAETLLMRLTRGSGIAGLAGVREARALAEGVRLVRPLLGWRKAALGELVAATELTAVDDPANADPRHDRTRVRTLLAEQGWIDPARLATSAAALAEAEAALAWSAGRLWEKHARSGPDAVTLYGHRDLPPELRRRLLLRALEQFGARPTGPEVARLLLRLEAGEPGTVGAAMVQVVGEEWQVRAAPPRRGEG